VRRQEGLYCVGIEIQLWISGFALGCPCPKEPLTVWVDPEVLRDARTFSCCTLQSTAEFKCEVKRKLKRVFADILYSSTSISRLIVSSPLIEEDREQNGAYCSTVWLPLLSAGVAKYYYIYD
jgi:hypothetical protein